MNKIRYVDMEVVLVNIVKIAAFEIDGDFDIKVAVKNYVRIDVIVEKINVKNLVLTRHDSGVNLFIVPHHHHFN